MKTILQRAFGEVNKNVPKNVIKTGKTGAAKRKMMTAIALSKARRAGAKIKPLRQTPAAYGHELPISG